MNADLTLTRSGELVITMVVGNTEAGIEFVDRWSEEKMHVHDVGVIFLPESEAFALAADAEGLTVERDLVSTEKRGVS